MTFHRDRADTLHHSGKGLVHDSAAGWCSGGPGEEAGHLPEAQGAQTRAGVPNLWGTQQEVSSG